MQELKKEKARIKMGVLFREMEDVSCKLKLTDTVFLITKKRKIHYGIIN